jgi:hypothetical protein
MNDGQAGRFNMMTGSAFAVIGLLLAFTGVQAETLRITTWNLAPRASVEATNAAGGKDEFPLEPAAAIVRRLDSDVLLLQQVRDWRMCDQLVQALKPADYKVLICSSFSGARGGASSRHQVAILAKTKAYFAWSDAWRKEGGDALAGGFAFAALRYGGLRVGLFSVQAGNEIALPPDAKQSVAREKAQTAAAGQLLEQVASVGEWQTNPVQVLVVSGTFDTPSQAQPALQETPLQLLERAGFGIAVLQGPAGEQMAQPGLAEPPVGMTDCFFTLPAGCAANPRVESTAEFAHQPMTCDIELDLAGAAVTQAGHTVPLPADDLQRSNLFGRSRAEAQPGVSASEQPSIPLIAPASQPSTLKPQLLWIATGALGGGAALGLLTWLLLRRRQAVAPSVSALITGWGEAEGLIPSSYTVVLGTRSGTAAAPAEERPALEPNPLIRIETPGTTQTQAEVLRRRVLAAEARADCATAVIRSGLIPHLGYWLKQKLVQKLMTDRARMLETQRAATLIATAVEKRLAKIELQVQRQNGAYQQHIEALTRQLEAAKEENRALICERIDRVKAEREAAQTRTIPQPKLDDGGGA